MAALKQLCRIDSMLSNNGAILCMFQSSNACFLGNKFVLPAILLSRQLHLTTCLEKRQSPRTVGIPAWKKAAIDRKQVVAKLRKPKSDETLKAEIRLQQKEKEFSIFTSSRITNIPKEKEFATRIQPEIFLSKVDNTIVCYHPAPNYPKEKTRPAWERPSWYGDRMIIEKYSDTLSAEQIDEAKKLREMNSKIWTAAALGHMFKVKPSTVSEQLPLTADELFEKEVEEKLLYEWGKSRRLDYEKYKNREILEYIRKTRGDAAVNEFRNKLDI